MAFWELHPGGNTRSLLVRIRCDLVSKIWHLLGPTCNCLFQGLCSSLFSYNSLPSPVSPPPSSYLFLYLFIAASIPSFHKSSFVPHWQPSLFKATDVPINLFTPLVPVLPSLSHKTLFPFRSPWRWKQLVSPTYQHLSTKLHRETAQS